LEYTAYLLITSYYGVELTALCGFIEIDGKAVKEAVLLILIVCKISVHSLLGIKYFTKLYSVDLRQNLFQSQTPINKRQFDINKQDE
jgi:hypothetical protein